MNGPFDSMFDFNGNDKLDPIEEAMLIDFLNDMQKKDSSDWNKTDKRDYMYPDLNLDELEDMAEDERRVAIEDAGYDPDDFDFDEI